jgi:hypothetical protein
MNPIPNNSPDPLQAVIDRTLRSLPDRQAPSSLETRVLAEIARREALPWWRCSWNKWPRPAQIVFLVASAALAAFAVTRGVAFMSGAEQALAGKVSGVYELLRTAVVACRDAFNTTFGPVPIEWQYAALAVVATGYLALTGLGVAAYRIFNPQR